MNEHEHAHQTQLFATSAAGSFWWVIDQLMRHGPSWQIVPPVMLGLVGLIGATNSFLNDRQKRQQSAEEHRLRMQALASGYRPGIEGLDPARN